MIGRLRGVIAAHGGDGSCIVDVGGLGYEVFVPAGALARLPSAPEPATLHVHTHVREEAITLYGFSRREDRDAFRVLLGVSSIGPKLALSIMNVLDAQRLAAAVQSGDKQALKNIPGIGRKTVDRLLVDLGDRLQAVAEPVAPAASQPAAAPPSGPLGTVVGALVQMGYKPSEAQKAVEPLRDKAESEPVEALIREALRGLG